MNNSITILVVEDDIIICEDIRSSLEKLGFTLLDTVSSGEAAIKKIRQKKPDFVMMDIVLSGRLNGIETAEIIVKTYQIPIIFVSAYSDPITKKRTENVHPYGYLTKPFHAEELKKVIQNALKKRKNEKKS
ncbi:response regulator [bacterium]|nr:response regulator [bacterium]